LRKGRRQKAEGKKGQQLKSRLRTISKSERGMLNAECGNLIVDRNSRNPETQKGGWEFENAEGRMQKAEGTTFAGRGREAEEVSRKSAMNMAPRSPQFLRTLGGL